MTDEPTTEEEPELTQDQKIEMMDQYRDLKRTGKPELANPILAALQKGEFYLAGKVASEVEVVEPPPRHGKGSGKDEWRAYAKEVSVMDSEIIDTFSKKEVIKALEANGLMEKVDSDDSDDE